MLQDKAYFHFFKKIALLSVVSSFSVYSNTALPSPDTDMEATKGSFAQFLEKTLHITVYDFDKAIGTADLLMMPEKGGAWCQIGALGYDLLGVGSGYRYLFRDAYPSRDWFLGLYAYSHFIGKSSYHRFKFNGGGEISTARFHYTLNGYYTYPYSERENFDYKESDRGTSLRLSTYYWQKMGMFGRVNPFFLGAYTKVKGVKENKAFKPFWMLSAGAGLRWELPHFVTVEIKGIWNQGEKICPTWEGGFQVEFAERKNKFVNYATQRIREMPQYYEPNYLSTDKKVSGKSKTELDTNLSHGL